ncbi:ribonuclease Z [Kistimonas scapharcae]|uniref:Ribonuclease Z n=1 Tax=Kistimonas scapharcae TaxID=1036133 RepID=A0ABP8V8A8_9GAMM
MILDNRTLMELTFLGTSAGVPTRHRNVTALALQPEQARPWILVDCGEGTQHRLLRCPLSVAKLGLILITHLHGDHCYGLPGLLASRAMATLAREHQSLTLIGPKGLKAMLEAIMHYSQLSLNFPLEIIELPEHGGEHHWHNHGIEAIPLKHNITSFAYQIKEPDFPGSFDKLLAIADGIPEGPVYGRLKQRDSFVLNDGRFVNGADYCRPDMPGRTVIIAGDNEQPALLEPYLSNCQLLVHEATYTESVFNQLTVRVQHSTAASVGSSSTKAGLKNLILTHFSPRYANSDKVHDKHSLDEIRLEAEQYFKNTLFLANDFDQYVLTRKGILQPKV